MGCVLSCGVKLVLQIFNTILFVAFIAVGIFGILLKTSKSIVESIINRLISDYHVNKEETAKLAQFIIDNADAVSALLIVAGFILAALCLIGCIASCCGCNILLKIYASVLIALVIVQIIVVAYFFSDPNRISKFIVISMTKSLEFYGVDDARGDISTAIWNLTMNFYDKGPCCGMKGYTDFANASSVPNACCKQPATTCSLERARKDKIDGCKGRIVNFTYEKMEIIMHVWIFGLILQTALVVLVLLVIRL